MLGFFVGSKDGELVRDTVGIELGEAFGFDEGIWDNLLVGFRDGILDWPTEGKKVGLDEGCDDVSDGIAEFVEG